MAGLPEDPNNWPSEIYQIEPADPVLGGVPNITTGAGKTNVPVVMLADRTANLNQRIGGIGGVAGLVSDLNALSASGIYEGTAAAIGHPDSGAACRVIHAEGATDASQLVETAAGESWSRVRIADTWGAWQKHWTGVAVIETLAPTGSARQPSGLTFKWRWTFASDGDDVLFSSAFPSQCFMVIAADAGGTAHKAQAYSRDAAGFVLQMLDDANQPVLANNAIAYWAVGI